MPGYIMHLAEGGLILKQLKKTKDSQEVCNVPEAN